MGGGCGADMIRNTRGKEKRGKMERRMQNNREIHQSKRIYKKRKNQRRI